MVDKSKVTLDARWGVNTRGVPEYDIMKDQREYVLTAWNTLKNQIYRCRSFRRINR